MSEYETNPSYILSISLGSGLYRHVCVPGDTTLGELADVIISLYDFQAKTAHVFFMNNKLWNLDDCIFMAEIDCEGDFRHSCDYCISDLGLKKGKKFKFVFNLGREWNFQCKVLEITDVEVSKPLLIRRVGQSPDQYSNFRRDRWD